MFIKLKKLYNFHSTEWHYGHNEAKLYRYNFSCVIINSLLLQLLADGDIGLSGPSVQDIVVKAREPEAEYVTCQSLHMEGTNAKETTLNQRNANIMHHVRNHLHSLLMNNTEADL